MGPKSLPNRRSDSKAKATATAQKSTKSTKVPMTKHDILIISLKQRKAGTEYRVRLPPTLCTNAIIHASGKSDLRHSRAPRLCSLSRQSSTPVVAVELRRDLEHHIASMWLL